VRTARSRLNWSADEQQESGVEWPRKESPRFRYVVSTHEPSARQLPTDHEHEADFVRPSNISVINRRFALSTPGSSCSTIRKEPMQKTERRRNATGQVVPYQRTGGSTARPRLHNLSLRARRPQTPSMASRPSSRTSLQSPRGIVCCNFLLGGVINALAAHCLRRSDDPTQSATRRTVHEAIGLGFSKDPSATAAYDAVKCMCRARWNELCQPFVSLGARHERHHVEVLRQRLEGLSKIIVDVPKTSVRSHQPE
jgi:hypothetical protein